MREHLLSVRAARARAPLIRASKGVLVRDHVWVNALVEQRHVGYNAPAARCRLRPTALPSCTVSGAQPVLAFVQPSWPWTLVYVAKTPRKLVLCAGYRSRTRVLGASKKKKRSTGCAAVLDVGETQAARQDPSAKTPAARHPQSAYLRRIGAAARAGAAAQLPRMSSSNPLATNGAYGGDDVEVLYDGRTACCRAPRCAIDPSARDAAPMPQPFFSGRAHALAVRY